jgi:hypothetical protein
MQRLSRAARNDLNALPCGASATAPLRNFSERAVHRRTEARSAEGKARD